MIATCIVCGCHEPLTADMLIECMELALCIGWAYLQSTNDTITGTCPCCH